MAGRAEGPVGEQTEAVEQGDFVAQQEVERCVSLRQLVEGPCQRAIEFRMGVSWRERTGGQVNEIGCSCCRAPVAAQAIAPLDGGAFAGRMDVIVFTRVVEQVAGVKEVVLSKERAFSTAGAFDRSRNPSLVGCQPSDDMRRFREGTDL